MNKFASFFSIVLLAVLTQCSGNMDVNTLGTLVITPGKCLPDAEDKYVYPVVPGMEEWASASPEEKARLSQLPVEKLKSISTVALIQSLLERPLLTLDYWASDNSSPIGTCYAIYSTHNSVSEFENRKDRVEALISYYDAVCFDCLPSLDVNAGEQFSVQLTVLEILFTKEKILRQLNTKQRKQAVARLLDKYKQKLNKETGINGSLAAMAWIMYDDNYPPVKTFYGNKDLSKENFEVYEKDMEDIILFTENYIHLN
jgi:hypothetical protein